MKVWEFITNENNHRALVFVGTLVIALIYAGQLFQMINANKINRDILVIGQRPWVIPSSAPKVSVAEGSSYLKITVQNIGASPALREELIMKPMAFMEVEDKSFDPVCKGAAAVAESGADPSLPNYGQTVYPKWNKPFEMNHPWTVPKYLDQKLAIIGCIAYVDEFRDSPARTPIHYTKFCFLSDDNINRLIAMKEYTFSIECPLGQMAD